MITSEVTECGQCFSQFTNESLISSWPDVCSYYPSESVIWVSEKAVPTCSYACFITVHDDTSTCDVCGERNWNEDILFVDETVFCQGCAPECSICKVELTDENLWSDNDYRDDRDDRYCLICVEECHKRYLESEELLEPALKKIHRDIRPLIKDFVHAFHPRDWQINIT